MLKPNRHFLFFGDTDNSINQLLRYTVVGGVSFLVDYSILFSLTKYVGLYYLISATISFLVGLVLNYILSTHWIFKKSRLSNKSVEFTVYGLIGVVGLLLNSILMYLFTDVLQIHYMLSKLVAASLVMIWNFYGRKVVLFE